MYLHNKYTGWYDSIILAAQSRTTNGYVERHHIIPKSLGGSDRKENLVSLTAREHFICHWLLTKMVTGQHLPKMQLALAKMCSISSNQQRYKITSRMFEYVRKQCSEATSGANNPMYGKPRSAKDKLAISIAVKAANSANGPRVLSEEHKQKIGLSKIGKPRPQWIIDKMRAASAGLSRDHNSGKHWYNDGSRSYLKLTCPPGCVPGRLS